MNERWVGTLFLINVTLPIAPTWLMVYNTLIPELHWNSPQNPSHGSYPDLLPHSFSNVGFRFCIPDINAAATSLV